MLDDRTEDDRLRQRACRANLFQLLPDRAMRADAIGQHLAWKNCPTWALLRGDSASDEETAADIRRAAERFGGKIITDRTSRYHPGSRRVDTGYQQVQTQMPHPPQDAGPYDVLFVADEHDLSATICLIARKTQERGLILSVFVVLLASLVAGATLTCSK